MLQKSNFCVVESLLQCQKCFEIVWRDMRADAVFLVLLVEIVVRNGAKIYTEANERNYAPFSNSVKLIICRRTIMLRTEKLRMIYTSTEMKHKILVCLIYSNKTTSDGQTCCMLGSEVERRHKITLYR